MRQELTEQKRTGWRRALLIAGAVLLPCCLGCLLYGEWGPSVGFAGLMGRLVFAAGFAMFGVSMAFFLAVLVAETVAPAGHRVLWGSHAGAKKHGANAPAISEMSRGSASTWRSDAERPFDKASLVREIVTLLLNLLIYGGGAIVALGASSSLDRADSFAHVALVVAVCAACVAAIVLWRRHRVRSGMRFTMLSNVGVPVLFAALALVGLIPGLVVGSQVASDMIVGPRTEMCVLQEFGEHHPTGRLAGIQQDTFSLAFATQDGKEARVTVAAADRAALVGVTEVGSEVELTYYPHAGVLVSAKLM